MTSEIAISSPLSSAQARLWFFHELDPESVTYNVPYRFRMHGRLDIDALRASIETIVERHEVLRSTIGSGPLGPRQTAWTLHGLSFRVHDLRSSGAAAGASAESLLDAEEHRAFSLATERPIRVTLVATSEDEWYLCVLFHHIAFDGVSGGIFFRELQLLYAAHLEHTVPQLAPLQLQYSDYAFWQQDSLRSGALAQQVDAACTALRGTAPYLDFGQRRSAAEGPNAPSALRVDLSLERSFQLRRLAARHRLTPFMLLLAAFGLSLLRFSGTRDFAIGCPTAGRRRPELDPIIGFFVNTLPIRIRVAPGATLSAYLASIRDEVLDAFDRQDAPLEVVIEKLRPVRVPGAAPLIQASLSWQSGEEAADLVLRGLTIEPVPAEPIGSKFPLSLVAFEESGAICAVFRYDANCLQPGIAQRIADHWTATLRAIVSGDDRGVEAIAGPSDAASQHAALPSRVTPSASSVPGLVRLQARRTPRSCAIAADGVELSYGLLDEQSTLIAQGLRMKGLARGDRVIVDLDRSPELIVAMLGVLKAGCAFVPVSPDEPVLRIGETFPDVRPALVITSRDRAWHDDAGAVPCCTIGDVMSAAPSGAVLPPVRISGDDLAYVMFTSGSSGKPKGVMIPHRAVVNHLDWRRETFRLGPGDRVLQKAPSTFDMSIFEIFGPLATGATVVVLPPGGHRDAAVMAATLQRERVTHVHFVPPVLREFIEGEGDRTYEHLRLVWCGGERLSTALAARATETLGVPIANLYGPTECTIDVTCATTWSGGVSVPIGRPIRNVRAYVLDANLQPTPTMVAGELYVAGEALAHGYAGQPALTAERFIPDPHGDIAGARMYRTGDLARFDEDGQLHFLGRLDRQLKVHGVRIEPAEIEDVLLRHPAVLEAVVVPDARSGSLVAHVSVGAGMLGGRDIVPELRSLLLDRLPVAFMPSSIHCVAHLPKQPSGKLDTSALRAAPDERISPADSGVLRGDVQCALGELWCRALELERVGPNDDFFELGGHSMLALRLVELIRERFGVPLPLVRLFRSPSIAALAPYLSDIGTERSSDEAWTPLVPLQSAGNGRPIYCFHGASGEVLRYRLLARTFAGVRPFFGLSARGLEGGAPFEHLDEAVTAYARAIVASSSPPYLIAGWSIGAAFAFAVARTIEREGKEVDLVLIFGQRPRPEPASESNLFRGFAAQFSVAGNAVSMPRLRESLVCAGVLPGATAEAVLQRRYDIYRRNVEMARRIAVRPAVRNALLIRAGDDEYFRGFRDRGLGWPDAVDDLRIETVGGGHDSILEEPHVRELARLLEDIAHRGLERTPSARACNEEISSR